MTDRAGSSRGSVQTLLVVAGEASGDLHGGELLRELKARKPGLRVVGVGGPRMAPWLDRHVGDIQALGVVGLVEVLKHLPALFRLKKALLEAAREEGVRHALFIDYPGFNFSLAKTFRARAPSMGLHHYVCPQVWAWKAGRIPALGRTLDTLYCLFDFEPPLFAGHPVEALWVGHPLVEMVRPEVDRETFFREAALDPDRPLVALLPGSRAGEVQRLLPPMAGLVKAWQADPAKRRFQWALAAAPTVPLEALRAGLEGAPVALLRERGCALRAFAAAALVCSGTATLETALLGTPFATLYRLHPLTYALARLLVRTPHFGLANIVAGRRIVPELLQGEVAPERLDRELERLLEPGTARRMKSDFLELRNRLGGGGAAGRVADHLLRCLEEPDQARVR